MACDAKREYLEREGDSYFERNFNTQKNHGESVGIKLFYEFICRQMAGEGYIAKGKRVLEIGCCYGYNLSYLNNKCGFDCYGIEPSNKAILYGREIYKNQIEITQGTVDNIKYHDEFFDIVIVGTCLYQVDRILLAKALEEIDRVLVKGGFLIVSDFDTPVPCKIENKHNAMTPTFKDNYGDMFLHRPYGYSLVEKKSYTFGGNFVFSANIQERMSTQILYKEKELFYCSMDI